MTNKAAQNREAPAQSDDARPRHQSVHHDGASFDKHAYSATPLGNVSRAPFEFPLRYAARSYPMQQHGVTLCRLGRVGTVAAAATEAAGGSVTGAFAVAVGTGT